MGMTKLIAAFTPAADHADRWVVTGPMALAGLIAAVLVVALPLVAGEDPMIIFRFIGAGIAEIIRLFADVYRPVAEWFAAMIGYVLRIAA